MMLSVRIAQRFATALDSEDYSIIETLLSTDCEYASPTGTLVGTKPIVDSYRSVSCWAESKIPEIQYRSEVRIEENGHAVIKFIDQLRHNGLSHTYSCEQEVLLNAAGEICRIVHRELPGQREALDEFLQAVGISRQI